MPQRMGWCEMGTRIGWDNDRRGFFVDRLHTDKRPGLYRIEGNSFIKVASFSSDNAAESFVDEIEAMLNRVSGKPVRQT